MKTSLVLVVLSVAAFLPALSRASASPSANAPACACATVNDVDQLPKPTSQARPAYPAELKGAKLAGEAVISFVVDETGHVRDAQSLRDTHPAFAASALAAVQRWEFQPALKDGVAVACRIEVPIVFDLAH